MTLRIATIMMVIAFALLAPGVLAEESDELEVFGLEAEKLLVLGSGMLAALLCALTFVAYKRTQRDKLGIIAIAFLLFAVKSLLIASELVIVELPFIDPISALLDFAILLTFFYGVVKR